MSVRYVARPLLYAHHHHLRCHDLEGKSENRWGFDDDEGLCDLMRAILFARECVGEAVSFPPIDFSKGYNVRNLERESPVLSYFIIFQNQTLKHF